MVNQPPRWEPGCRLHQREHWAGSPPRPPLVVGAVGAGCRQFPGTGYNHYWFKPLILQQIN